jgi:hypothetical protein
MHEYGYSSVLKVLLGIERHEFLINLHRQRPERGETNGVRDAYPSMKKELHGLPYVNVRYRIGDRWHLYSVVKIQVDNRLTVRLGFDDPLLDSKQEET